LLREGFNGVPGAPRRGRRASVQRARPDGQLPGHLQNEWAGAQAFSSFDTYLAPYVRKDGLGLRRGAPGMQEFIYNLNVPSRWGTQTPFTNLTFDWVCPEDLREQVPVIAGEEMPFTYGELQAEMDADQPRLHRGDDGRRRPRPGLHLPHSHLQHHPGFSVGQRERRALFDMTARYGLPYFQNFLNSELKPNQVRSMCCRLQLDVRELLKRGNGLFGSAEQTGSLGVVTINCARLGFAAGATARRCWRSWTGWPIWPATAWRSSARSSSI
jgi:anaerobic ribonucleoside-triphosphate reductase